MRYEVYDDEGNLFRRFWDKHSALRFMQEGWKLVVKDKQPKPSVETHGEARW